MAKKAIRSPKTLCSNLYQADYPSRSVLNHVTSRWGSLILIVLLQKTHCVSELASRIGGVSEKMLAQSLQALEADRFRTRTVHPTELPKVEYSPTKHGREIARNVRRLTNWEEVNIARVMEFCERHSSST